MIRTVHGWINPLIWAVSGWLIAVAGNTLMVRMLEMFGEHALHGQLRHIDEAFIGIAIGCMRWAQGEWKVGHIHESRQMETKVRGALQVLYHSTNEDYRRQALRDVLTAFETHRPMHPDFRLSVEAFLGKRFQKDAEGK